MDPLEQFKAGQRAAWSAGEFDEVAARLWPAGGALVEALEIGPGDVVVDVGCGTGNASIQAAQAGATVTGVDLAPGMLARARAASEAAGLEITWAEGDAEAIPLPDASADVVVSTFGCMFAPRHAAAAAEILRVLRPGGRFGVCAWTADSPIAAFLQVVGRHLPPPPAFAEPPLLWGDPDHVEEIFGDGATEVCFRHGTLDVGFGSFDEGFTLYTERFGPLLTARAELEPRGAWEPLVEDLRGFLQERVAADGTLPLDSTYLMTLGRRAT